MRIAAYAILISCVVACDAPRHQGTETRSDQKEGLGNRAESPSNQPVAAVHCPKPDCGLTNINLHDLVPEDNEHCAVWCCLGGPGSCYQQMVPWINKSTGKTDAMYDTRDRKFIKVN